MLGFVEYSLRLLERQSPRGFTELKAYIAGHCANWHNGDFSTWSKAQLVLTALQIGHHAIGYVSLSQFHCMSMQEVRFRIFTNSSFSLGLQTTRYKGTRLDGNTIPTSS